jgi:hypothetical protein
VRQRLWEHGEVVGADEQFFEDGLEAIFLRNLYAGTPGVLDEDVDGDVDLDSYAYQIWRNATAANPALKKKVEDLPDVVYTARALDRGRSNGADAPMPPGALVYLRMADGGDALAWIDEEGHSVTQSQFAILKAAECTYDTPAVPRSPRHHELVKAAVNVVEQERTLVGGLGSIRGARYRVYEALKRYHAHLQQTAPLLITEALTRAIDDVYRYPLRPSATDTLNRQLRSGIADEQLAELVIALREGDRLSVVQETNERGEPQIVCSLGLVATKG